MSSFKVTIRRSRPADSTVSAVFPECRSCPQELWRFESNRGMTTKPGKA